MLSHVPLLWPSWPANALDTFLALERLCENLFRTLKCSSLYATCWMTNENCTTQLLKGKTMVHESCLIARALGPKPLSVSFFEFHIAFHKRNKLILLRLCIAQFILRVLSPFLLSCIIWKPCSLFQNRAMWVVVGVRPPRHDSLANNCYKWHVGTLGVVMVSWRPVYWTFAESVALISIRECI